MPSYSTSLEREKKFVQWLDLIKEDASELYILGDLFDFWFEYQKVVPRGYVRLLGKLVELSDGGLPITVLTGNHDLWMKDYFEKELGIIVFHHPIQKEFSGKKFYLGHGDGLGPGDHGFKFIKKVFTSSVCQWLFRWIHPDISFKLAEFWSRKSRQQEQNKPIKFKGKENEWLYQYAIQVLEKEHFDYFIFGHRHLPLNISLNEQSSYINLGDWIKHFTYAKFNGQDVELLHFNGV